MSTKAAVFVVACGTLAFGCADPGNNAGETQEIIDNLTQAGFPHSEITVVDGVVYVGNDAAVSLQASREMLEISGSTTKEQYRTTNLVSRSVNPICIDPRPCDAISAKFNTALRNAAANYTALPLTFDMPVRANGDFTGCDAIITCRILSGATGGSAGFPSGGLPFNTINIGTGLNSASFSVDLVEHVITHELGHTIGFRHSDWFNPCGSGRSESDAGVGAIHIPGTPTGMTSSVMNACFRTVETGEFTSTDVVALNVLYGL